MHRRMKLLIARKRLRKLLDGGTSSGVFRATTSSKAFDDMTSGGASAAPSRSMAGETIASGHGSRMESAAKSITKSFRRAGAMMNKLLTGWATWAVTQSAWYALVFVLGYLLGRAM